ncbi:hypothetical protein Y032_0072g693 [Ancylostoma ceylanicum]|uniref:Uncharacterized protein n=1 Tax=Ancylostoma ceylanicum TaxID=53326 RepID=A0A016TXN0_9BILA|nr:hypothetical protein Y032_0072g693 [Ancylostoma ceylanicum]
MSTRKVSHTIRASPLPTLRSPNVLNTSYSTNALVDSSAQPSNRSTPVRRTHSSFSRVRHEENILYVDVEDREIHL